MNDKQSDQNKVIWTCVKCGKTSYTRADARAQVLRPPVLLDGKCSQAHATNASGDHVWVAKV